MKPGISTVERSFDIARSGKVGSMTDLKEILKCEAYDLNQIQGRELVKQLREAIREARKRNEQNPV